MVLSLFQISANQFYIDSRHVSLVSPAPYHCVFLFCVMEVIICTYIFLIFCTFGLKVLQSCTCTDVYLNGYYEIQQKGEKSLEIKFTCHDLTPSTSPFQALSTNH